MILSSHHYSLFSRTLTTRHSFFFLEELFMSADFIARLVGMVVFAILGTYWGAQIGALATANEIDPRGSRHAIRFHHRPGRGSLRLDPDPLFHHPPRAGSARVAGSRLRADAHRRALRADRRVAHRGADGFPILAAPGTLRFHPALRRRGPIRLPGRGGFCHPPERYFQSISQLQPPGGAAECGGFRCRMGGKPHASCWIPA